MILQDLIRNYILYREVMRPLLNAWKESITVGSYKEFIGSFSYELNLALNKAKTGGGGEELGWDISDEYEAMALTKRTGTHTINTMKTLLTTEYNSIYEEKSKNIQALSSNSIHIVLGVSPYKDYIAGARKTSTTVSVSSAIRAVLSLAQADNITTGYESKQLNSYLISETHEKREYLGEFSLTHEETHLISSRKGGGYHDINQESVAAII